MSVLPKPDVNYIVFGPELSIDSARRADSVPRIHPNMGRKLALRPGAVMLVTCRENLRITPIPNSYDCFVVIFAVRN